MRIRKKLVLVLAIAATQAVCLAWGVVVFDRWLTTSMRQTIHAQILEDNVETARQMTRLIREMRVGDPRRDEASWQRLQNVVREIELPNEGFVCLTDSSTGRVLCHPRLAEWPRSAGLVARGAGIPAPEADLRPAPVRDVAARVIGSGEALQIIAAAPLPEIGAKVLVHQLGRGVDAAIARVTQPVRPIGFAVSLGLVAVTAVAVAGVVQRYENRLAEINEHLEQLVRLRTRALTKTRDGLIFGLAKLAESRDTDTGEHLDRIAKYVTILAKQLQQDGVTLSDAEIHDLALASSLHDIGKVGVPDSVLLKPGRLDPDERRVIETHAVIGGDCLRALSDRLGEDDFLQAAEEIAYGHHERWDGTGYPFQRAGAQIPLSARIVAVADVYDALRSKRPYKDAMPHEQAREILVSDSGSHFDPVVIEAFLAAEEAFRDVASTAEQMPTDGAETEDAPFVAARG